jgi:hypothetical protein
VTFEQYVAYKYGMTLEQFDCQFQDLTKEEIRHLYDTDVKK